MVTKYNILVISFFIMGVHASFKPHPVLKALENFVEHIIERKEKENKNPVLQIIERDEIDNNNPVLQTLNEFVEHIIGRKVRALETEMESMRHKIEDTSLQINQQIPVFHALLSKDVLLSAEQTVVFDDVITNIGGAYNPKNGHFTVPKNGVYFFNASFLKIGSYHLHLKMVANGTIITRGHATNSAAGSTTGTMTAAVQLKAGDVVKVVGYNPNETIHGHWSFFTGYLISYNV